MTDSQIYMSAIGFGGGAYGEESSIYSFWEDFAQHYNNLSTHPIIPPNTMSQEILDNSGLDIISANNLGDAAKKAVQSAKEQ